MGSYLLTILIWAMAVVGTGVFIIRRRKSELNLVAYSIYCVGCTWAVAELFSRFLGAIGISDDVRLILAWLSAGAVGGTVSWRWWNANQTVAAEAASGPGPGPAGASPVGQDLHKWERAITLTWLGVGGSTFFLMSAYYEWQISSILKSAICYDLPRQLNCYANVEAAVLFGAYLVAVRGSVLFFGRGFRLGTVERWAYGVGIGLSFAVMVLFWTEAILDW